MPSKASVIMAHKRQLVQELQDAHGRVTVEQYLAAITPPDHPLHDTVQWDDRLAAHEHRLEQCREHIRSVRIEVVDRHIPAKKVKVSQYARDPRLKAEPGYVNLEFVRPDPAHSEEVVREKVRSISPILRQGLLQAHFLGLANLFVELVLKDLDETAQELKEVPRPTAPTHKGRRKAGESRPSK